MQLSLAMAIRPPATRSEGGRPTARHHHLRGKSGIRHTAQGIRHGPFLDSLSRVWRTAAVAMMAFGDLGATQGRKNQVYQVFRLASICPIASVGSSSRSSASRDVVHVPLSCMFDLIGANKLEPPTSRIVAKAPGKNRLLTRVFNLEARSYYQVLVKLPAILRLQDLVPRSISRT